MRRDDTDELNSSARRIEPFSVATDRVTPVGDDVTHPAGEVLWISPALPGHTHDLTAARTHRIIRICQRQGVPILAGRAYQRAGPWGTTGLKPPPGGELALTQRTVNRAQAATRAPVERGMARLKCWQIFRRSRISPSLLMMLSSRLSDGEVALVHCPSRRRAHKTFTPRRRGARTA